MKMSDMNKPLSVLDMLGVNPNGQPYRELQSDAYKSGRALVGHVNDAHKGIEQSDCRACKELRAKYEGR